MLNSNPLIAPLPDYNINARTPVLEIVSTLFTAVICLMDDPVGFAAGTVAFYSYIDARDTDCAKIRSSRDRNVWQYILCSLVN